MGSNITTPDGVIEAWKKSDLYAEMMNHAMEGEPKDSPSIPLPNEVPISYPTSSFFQLKLLLWRAVTKIKVLFFRV